MILDYEKINSFINVSKEKLIYDIINDYDLIDKFTGIRPEHKKRICSPLRLDNNPGCWFEEMNGKLMFRDFAGQTKPIDAIEFIRQFHNIPTRKEAIDFILETLILDKKVYIPQNKVISSKPSSKKLFYVYRHWNVRDVEYWEKYGISVKQLKEDKVMPISYKLYKYYGDPDVYSIITRDGYAFEEFSPRVKLYFPHDNEGYKFLGKTNKNDIGNIHNIDKSKEHIIITKSYKDARIIRNYVDDNVIWFQSENIIPEDKVLIDSLSFAKKIIILYDYDETGILCSVKLENKLYDVLEDVKIKMIYTGIREYKDISDLYVGEKRYFKVIINKLCQAIKTTK